MITLEKATLENAEWISAGVSNYFIQANERIGKDYYKTDKNLMFEHINKRLQSNVWFEYMLFMNDQKPVWFFAYLIGKNDSSTIEVVNLVCPEEYVDEASWLMIKHLLQVKEQQGCKKILCEVFDFEGMYINAIKKHGGFKTVETYIIN